MTITNDPTAVKTVDIQGIVEPVVAGVDSNGQPADAQPADSVDNPKAYGCYNKLRQLWAVPPQKEAVANDPPAAKPQGGADEAMQLSALVYVDATNPMQDEIPSPMPGNLSAKAVSKKGGYEQPKHLGNVVEIDSNEAQYEIEHFGVERSELNKQILEAKYGMKFHGASRRIIEGTNSGDLMVYMKDDKGKMYQINLGLTDDTSASRARDHIAEISSDEVQYEIEKFGVELRPGLKEELEAKYGGEIEGASRRSPEGGGGGYLMAYQKYYGKMYQIELGFAKDSIAPTANEHISRIDSNEAQCEIEEFGAEMSETEKQMLEVEYGMKFEGASRRIIQGDSGGYLMAYMKDEEGNTHQINCGWRI